MTSESKLNTLFHTPRADDTINNMKFIFLRNNDNHHTISNPKFNVKLFTTNEFNEFNECIDYIKSRITNSMFLIVPNTIVNTLIPMNRDCPRITSIYIFSKDEQYQNDPNGESKVRGIFNDIDIMLKQFQDDSTSLRGRYYSEQNTLQNINTDNDEVLWGKGFDKMLQHTNIAENKFTSLCQQFYSNDRRILKQIIAFCNTFYNTDEFNQDIDLYIKTFCSRMYRGATLSTEGIELYKHANSYWTPWLQFRSTFSRNDVKRVFAGNSIDDQSRQSVFFKYEQYSYSFRTYVNTKSIAHDSVCSVIGGVVNAILLSMHSIFRLLSKQPRKHQICIRQLSKRNQKSIFSHLLFHMISQMMKIESAKDKLLQFCQSKYIDDLIKLNKIHDFERNYQLEYVAKWYSTDNFLRRLLNQSLRTETIDYIYDLHNQLAQLQPSFIQSGNVEQKFILYRGQHMPISELNQLRENRGVLFSINTFFSTTFDTEVAIIYSGDGLTTNPDPVSVIYKMLIDANIRSTPYAITESVNSAERECLFLMAAKFLIGDINELYERMNNVKLPIVHKDYELWNKLITHLKVGGKSILKYIAFSCFALYTAIMKDNLIYK